MMSLRNAQIISLTVMRQDLADTGRYINSSISVTSMKFCFEVKDGFFLFTFWLVVHRFTGACFLMDKWWQSKELSKDQCRVALSSRRKSSCSREFITKMLLAFWDFVLNKENRCWFMSLCLMEHSGKACQVSSKILLSAISYCIEITCLQQTQLPTSPLLKYELQGDLVFILIGRGDSASLLARQEDQLTYMSLQILL